jgi:hypothetical protein
MHNYVWYSLYFIIMDMIVVQILTNLNYNHELWNVGSTSLLHYHSFTTMSTHSSEDSLLTLKRGQKTHDFLNFVTTTPHAWMRLISEPINMHGNNVPHRNMKVAHLIYIK